MKKHPTLSVIAVSAILTLVFIACQKSNDADAGANDPGSTTSSTFNNLKIDASVVKGWLADSRNTQITFTFFSKTLDNAGSKMTLAAFDYDKSNPIILEIVSRNQLVVKENIGFSNNYMPISSVRKMITKSSGEMIDFDYILLEPHYYEAPSGSYVRYRFIPYKDGRPVTGIQQMRTEDDCGPSSNPSPPADPCEGNP